MCRDLPSHANSQSVRSQKPAADEAVRYTQHNERLRMSAARSLALMRKRALLPVMYELLAAWHDLLTIKTKASSLCTYQHNVPLEAFTSITARLECTHTGI